MFIQINNEIIRESDIKRLKLDDDKILILDYNDDTNVIQFKTKELALAEFNRLVKELHKNNTCSIGDSPICEDGIIEEKTEELISKLDSVMTTAKETLNIFKDKVHGISAGVDIKSEVNKLRSALNIDKLLSKNNVNFDNFGFDKEITEKDIETYNTVAIKNLTNNDIIDLVEKIIAQELNTNPETQAMVKLIQTSIPNKSESAKACRKALLSYRDELVEYLSLPEFGSITMVVALASR